MDTYDEVVVQHPPTWKHRLWHWLINIMTMRNFCVIYSLIQLVAFFSKIHSHQEPLLVIRGKAPSRFFPNDCGVKDYFNGELQGLSRAVRNNDITVVFFYAPWCRISLDARDEFVKVAKKYQNQVSFIAVNCAWDSGECANKRRPEVFPLIGAYVHYSHRSFITFGGVPLAEHWDLFISRLLRPYLLLTTERDLQTFVHSNQIAVVAITSAVSQNYTGFSHFVTAAVLHLRHDPRGEVRFGVLSPSVAGKHGFTQTDVAYLYRSGNPHQFVTEIHRKSASDIENMARNGHLNSGLSWMFPNLHKEFTLSQKLNNATLLLFAPYGSSDCRPYHDVMRRVIAEYNDCKNASNASLLLQVDRNMIMQRRQPENPSSTERCRFLENSFKDLAWIDRRLSKKRCVCISSQKTLNSTVDVCWNKRDLFPDTVAKISVIPALNCSKSYACSDGQLLDSKYSVCCYPNTWNDLKDRKVVLMELAACRQRPVSCDNPEDVVDMYAHADVELVRGLRCVTNRTLEFVALDSDIYPAYVSRLGIKANGNRRAQVLIVDKKNAASFIMDAPFSASNVARFISNYTKSLLDVVRLSEKVDLPLAAKKTKPKFVLLDDITADTFEQAVMNDTKDVVLLHYTPWCAFCKPAMTLLYQLAARFANVSNLAFKRINTQLNELPWETRQLHVPALQFFPTQQKYDNVAVFPVNDTLSMDNVIRFILLHSSDSVKQQYFASNCESGCWTLNQNRSKRLTHVFRRELKRLRHSRAFCQTCDTRALDWRIRETHSKLDLLQRVRDSGSARDFLDSVPKTPMFFDGLFRMFSALDRFSVSS